MPDLGESISRAGEDKNTRLTFEDRDRANDPVYEPDENAKKLIAKIERLWKERDTYKRPHERKAFQVEAAILGQHWITWVPSMGTFQIPATSARLRKARVTINKMMPYYRSTRAKLTSNRPGFHVAPNNTDPEAVERAELQTHVLDGEWERIGGQRILKDIVGLMLNGNVIVGPRWNPNAGEVLYEDQPVMQEQLDEMTGQVVQVPAVDPQSGQPQTQRVAVKDPKTGQPLRMGQMEIRLYSIFEFDFDWYSTNLQESGAWCMTSGIETLDWIIRTYPEFGRFVKGEDVYVDQLWLKRARELVGQGAVQSAPLEGEKTEHAVIVKEYWERPTAERPNGRLLVVANGVLLFDGENPFWRMLQEGFAFPFVHSGEVRIPKRQWYEAMISQGFPINRQLNRAYSQEETNRALIGDGKYFIPNGAEIPETALQGDGVEKVAWTPSMPGAKPEVVVPPSTTEAANSVIAHIERNLQDVMSYHEISQGVAPQGDRSGVMIDSLKKSDETPLGDTEGNLLDLLTDVGKMILCICSQYWTEERLVIRTGWDGSTIARKAGGSALAGGPGDRFDVRVTPQSTMRKDPAAQRQEVKELQEMGYLNPAIPQHRTLGLKMLARADIQEVYKNDKLDIDRSNAENIGFKSGIQVMPDPFENHAICIEEHNNWRKSEQYRALPIPYRLIADQHVEMHELLEVQQAQKKAMREIEANAPIAAAEAARTAAGAKPPNGTPPKKTSAPAGEPPKPPPQ